MNSQTDTSVEAGPIDHLLGRDAGSAAKAERTRRIAVLLVDPDRLVTHASREEPDR